jgi:hypothetical protein
VSVAVAQATEGSSGEKQSAGGYGLGGDGGGCGLGEGGCGGLGGGGEYPPGGAGGSGGGLGLGGGGRGGGGGDGRTTMADTAGTGSAAAVKAEVSAVAKVEVREALSAVGGATVITENCTFTPDCASLRRPAAPAETLMIAMLAVEMCSDDATPEIKAVCAAP